MTVLGPSAATPLSPLLPPGTDPSQFKRDLSLGLPLEAKARHVFVNGDIAQIVVDWSIDGTGPDGEHVHVEGTASDVARRGADGRWRDLIDNRLGTAVQHLRANLQAATLTLPSDTLAKLEALGEV